MKDRPRRYQFAFLALGWAVLLALAFQLGLDRLFQGLFDQVTYRVTTWTQELSEAEASVVNRARHTSRREYLEPVQATLSDPAALRDPQFRLWGAYDGGFPGSFEGFDRLEQSLDFRFHLISFYTAWGDRPDQQFPKRLAESIAEMGSVPLITWEPWVVDFDPRIRTNLPPLEKREYASLMSIAAGDYDFFIVPWARAAAEYGKPLMLRFAHEMNDPYRYPWGPQNGNRPDDFIAAWIHVHQVFQKMGANNVLWVWAPHISMPWVEFYYPGDEYVDWIGLGVLNYGNVASWSRWWSFHQILEKAYPSLVALNKPIMICELGTLSAGGDVAEWYRQTLYQLNHNYSRIQAVVLFNDEADRSMSPEWPLDWALWQDDDAVRVVAGGLARDSRY